MAIVMKKINYKNKLKNISLSIKTGLITAIVGDNNKYLLSLICGGIKQDSGSITVAGIDLELYDSYIPYITNNDLYFYTKTVKEELKFALEYTKTNVKDKEAKFKNILELSGLSSKYLDREIKTLSSSEKYMLNIARSIVADFSILILDNVLGGLDNNNKKAIIFLIRELKELGKTIILANEDINLLYNIVDEVIIINKDTVVTHGDINKIYTDINILSKKDIEIPLLSLFTYKAKELKDVKLFYHKDVRDIIKDIYKHV